MQEDASLGTVVAGPHFFVGQRFGVVVVPHFRMLGSSPLVEQDGQPIGLLAGLPAQQLVW